MGKSVSLDYDIGLQFGVSAGLVLNELSFWSTKKSSRKDGWIYKTYDEMMERLPLSESTIRRAYKTLKEAGLIETKIMRLNDTPVLHYKMTESESVKLTGTIETVKLTDSINTVSTHKDSNSDSENNENSSVSFGADVGGVNVPAAADEAAENKRLMEYIISVINPREKPIESRMKMLRGRLKDGYTRKEIALTAQVLAQSQWHKDNKQMTVDNLLAPSKFGRLYAQIDQTTDGQVMTDDERRAADRERIRKEQAEQMKRNQAMIDAGV